eukprot:9341149-Pyramimonas_sp.AAC.1
MGADARLGAGGAESRQGRLDHMCQAIYRGVEKRLVPLFQPADACKHAGRGGAVEYHHSAAGGALAFQRPAGTSYSRALRTFPTQGGGPCTRGAQAWLYTWCSASFCLAISTRFDFRQRATVKIGERHA